MYKVSRPYILSATYRLLWLETVFYSLRLFVVGGGHGDGSGGAHQYVIHNIIY